jgi:two-component system CitB family response regulator
VRAAFDTPGADWSAAEIAKHVGVSRATASRYLTHLVKQGALELYLRYGTTGRPEHRYRRTDV